MPAKYPRTGKWIIPAGHTWSPGSIVSVLCTTNDIGRDPLTGWTASELKRVHVAESHRRRGVWTGTLFRSFDTGAAFHDWLEKYACDRRRTYVFAPDVMRTLILTDWWNRIEARGCKLVRSLTPDAAGDPSPTIEVEVPEPQTPVKASVQVSDPGLFLIHTLIHGVECDIVKYRTHGKGWQWAAHKQYIKADEETLAKAIAYTWRRDASIVAGTTHTHRSPVDRVHLWCKWYQALADWWLSIDGGPWAATTAGLAWSFLRKRLKPRTVLHHADERAGELEHDALHGGRRSVWYLGNVGTEDDWRRAHPQPPERSPRGMIHGPIDHWDVKSMYPWLLSRLDYPIERIDFKRRVSPEYIRIACNSFGVIARVVLKTLTPEYPVHTEKGICYPVGVFTTTLAGPELVMACGAGEVLHVHRAAFYKLGRPFASAVDPLLRMRSEYHEQGLKGWELFAKSIAVAMSGKLAPNQHHWIPRPTTPAPEPWCEWPRRDGDTGEIRHYIARANMVWERCKSKKSVRPMGAAYAYLTAYGRVMMRLYRNTLPPRCVLAQDTDGMWCTSIARDTLNYVKGEPTSGDLIRDAERTTRAARFWNPQRYWYGHDWVLSGIHSPENDPGTATIRGRKEIGGLDRTRSTPRPLTFAECTREKLHESFALGDVDEAGWVQPPKLWHDQG